VTEEPLEETEASLSDSLPEDESSEEPEDPEEESDSLPEEESPSAAFLACAKTIAFFKYSLIPSVNAPSPIDVK
jgi:hypothetical protein